MRVHSYTIVHYGKDYLSWALRSVYDQVDVLNVVYTPHPSHGHQTDANPPESKEEIIAAAFAYDPDRKVRWHEVTNFYYEGQHRDFALSLCKDAELALVVDCDEVWDSGVLERALQKAFDEGVRNCLVNFIHLWRSFSWCVKDNMWPLRIIDLRRAEGTAYIPKEWGGAWHFGYAVRDPIMAYKWRIHGHKDELRPVWWNEKWTAWPPVGDCHPTCLDTWTPIPFDKAILPSFMREHPFYHLEKIE